MERLTRKSIDGTVHATRIGYYEIIEKLAQYEELEEQCIKECGCGLNMIVQKYNEFLEHMHELAEFWELEKQGLLLRLPVVEGATVYTLSYFYECDCDYNCVEFEAYKCEEDLPCEHQYKKYRVKESEFRKEMLAVFGKTVFLTKEEAEAALERMKGEDHE